ncbi:MAG: major capsid protein [Arizlama microvirus]|nr:MAG: major capsid protein [Arizlama microvirus]
MKRSKLNWSHYKLLTADMGEIVPLTCREVLPGDSVQHSTSCMLRVSPLLSPVMHPVHVKIHHWFVPTRLIWEDWESFITGGSDGMDDSEHPVIACPATTGFTEGSLADYLGVRPGTPDQQVSALPFRAYALIFNEYYRDQDLVTELTIDKSSGLDTTTNTALQNAAWEKDYFTSARPWEQKGPSVTIPLTGNAPVTSDGTNVTINSTTSGGARSMLFGAGGSVAYSGAADSGAVRWSNTGMEADLSGVSAVDMNDLRLAMSLQRFEEARARYGSRYTEYLRYLGVRSSDARLQRPEYLGGGKQTIQFSEVLQTAEGTNPVGELRGHGISALRSNKYRRFFEEHGFIMSFIIVRPRAIYADGLERMWNRRTKEDYWQKELQHIGQQEVLNKEVYMPHTTPNGVFGYQDRYDEYRRANSTIAGQFRSTLNFWHYARLFSGNPTLNADFVKSVPTKRVNAVTNEDCLWIMANHNMVARSLVSPVGTSFIY